MKRWGSLLLILLLLWGAAGCAKSAPVPPQTEGWCCTVTGRYGELSLGATVRRTGLGALEWQVTEPAALAGLTLRREPDGTTRLQYRQLQYTAPSLPVAAVSECLCTVLDDVAHRAAQAARGCLTGTCGGGAYEYRYGSAGEPLSLTVPALALQLTFAPVTEGKENG